MTNDEYIFKKFDKLFVWEYRQNKSGVDLLVTKKGTFENYKFTADSLEDCFNLAFSLVVLNY